jgi:FtsZ-binding cell division protein ZapB
VALDPFAVAVDTASIAVMLLIFLLGYKALEGFNTSRKAVTESATLLDVIVNALSARVQQSESTVNDLRFKLDALGTRSLQLQDEQGNLRSDYLQVLTYLQEIMSNDKRLILEVEQLKKKFGSLQTSGSARLKEPSHVDRQNLIVTGDILASLTPTERQTIDILAREGPKAAPELGKRLRKSREHTARLMKKLYLEGYVDRESNHPPYRYKVNERVRGALDSAEKQVTAKASEKA